MNPEATMCPTVRRNCSPASHEPFSREFQHRLVRLLFSVFTHGWSVPRVLVLTGTI